MKPVKRRHQLYQPSIKRNQKIKNKSLKPVNRGINCANVQILNIQRQEFQAVDYCFGKRAVTSSMVGSCTSEIIFIVFLSPISHINGDIAAAAYLWWIKERAIYRIPYSWSSITYGGPTLILEIVKDRKEKQFVLEFVLVEKIVLRWGGETEQYLLLKSLKQFAKNIFSFFYVRIFVFFSLFNLFDWFA